MLRSESSSLSEPKLFCVRIIDGRRGPPSRSKLSGGGDAEWLPPPLALLPQLQRSCDGPAEPAGARRTDGVESSGTGLQRGALVLRPSLPLSAPHASFAGESSTRDDVKSGGASLLSHMPSGGVAHESRLISGALLLRSHAAVRTSAGGRDPNASSSPSRNDVGSDGGFGLGFGDFDERGAERLAALFLNIPGSELHAKARQSAGKRPGRAQHALVRLAAAHPWPQQRDMLRPRSTDGSRDASLPIVPPSTACPWPVPPAGATAAAVAHKAQAAVGVAEVCGGRESRERRRCGPRRRVPGKAEGALEDIYFDI
eukprot:6208430-Pleurochrysis_carterae.AAC.4